MIFFSTEDHNLCFNIYPGSYTNSELYIYIYIYIYIYDKHEHLYSYFS